MPEDEKRPDVVLLRGPTDDGEGVQVLRARGQGIEVGEVRPLKEGKPLVGGEVVKLVPRAESANVCDVEVMATIGPGTTASNEQGGPPQVATREYRSNWDRIFGEPSKPEAQLN